jgi:hypothetical protein
MSAPPTADVVVYPLMKLSAVFAASAPAAIMGLPGAMVTKAPIVAMLAESKPPLMMCLPGRMVGLEETRPASLRKATMEPVKVIPPAKEKTSC